MLASLLVALSVSACGSGSDPEIDASGYRAYLQEHAAQLVRDAQAMQPELEHGKIERAESRYSRARVRYAQIQPAAERLAGLNAAINAAVGEVPPGRLRGFHRIEQALWEDHDAAAVAHYGRLLIADTKGLKRQLGMARFSAQQLAASTVALLHRVSTVTLAGREDPLANTGLLDTSANLEAVGAMFEALRPVLSEEEQVEIGARLTSAYEEIEQYGVPARFPKSQQVRGRSPGAIFVWLSEVTPEGLAKLRSRVAALSQPFEELETSLD